MIYDNSDVLINISIIYTNFNLLYWQLSKIESNKGNIYRTKGHDKFNNKSLW